MWYLRSNTDQLIYLKINKELTFGRRKGDIILKDDDSISRLHACISVEIKEIIELGKPTSMCKVKDLGSKYGTYVLKGNDMIDVRGDDYILEDQDKIRCGLLNHIYTLIYVPIVTVVSSLTQDDSKKLQTLMEEIDGVITNDWISSCTHLTVSKATLTEKVVCAMASTVPIVDIKYWEHVKLAFDNGEKLPDPNDFVLHLVESLVTKETKLVVNKKRKTLFKDLIFVFFNKRQCKQYEKMIKLAGGQLVLYTMKPLSEKQLRAPNVIVVQYSSSDETQSTQSLVPEYETIYNTLQSKNRRMISESEIPLAILQCSMSTQCNPKFVFRDLLKRSQARNYSSPVLAPDTNDILCDAETRPKIISDVLVKTNMRNKISSTRARIIPDTCDSSSNVDSLSNFTVDSQAKGPPTISADYIPETIDSLSRTSLDTQKCHDTVEKLNSNNCDYIAETADSASIFDPVVKNVSQSPLKSAHNLWQLRQKEVVEGTENSNRIIPDTMSQSSNKIELDIERCLQSQREQNSTKSNDSDEVIIHEIPEKLPKVVDVIEIDMEDDNSSFKPPMTIMPKAHRTKVSNIARQSLVTDKEKFQNTNTDNDRDEIKGNLQFRGSTRKGSLAEDPISRELLHSEIVTSTPRVANRNRVTSENSSNCDTSENSSNRDTAENCSNRDTSENSSDRDTAGNSSNHGTSGSRKSSFLRTTPGYKRFQKVYKMIPAKRIALADMYVWNENNVRPT